MSGPLKHRLRLAHQLVLVTDHGFEPLHAAERALFRLR
jgi:hypothetical protein